MQTKGQIHQSEQKKYKSIGIIQNMPASHRIYIRESKNQIRPLYKYSQIWSETKRLNSFLFPECHIYIL